MFLNRTKVRCCSTGAALNVWYSSVLIRQCIISNNRVYRGAIYGYGSTFTIEQTTFRSNHYASICCGSNYYGGAILYLERNVIVDISNSTFNTASVLVSRNGARSYGGAIYICNVPLVRWQLAHY